MSNFSSSFINSDITYCANKNCKRTDCRRHFKNICAEGYYSMCEFNKDNKENCDSYWGTSETWCFKIEGDLL